MRLRLRECSSSNERTMYCVCACEYMYFYVYAHVTLKYPVRISININRSVSASRHSLAKQQSIVTSMVIRFYSYSANNLLTTVSQLPCRLCLHTHKQTYITYGFAMPRRPVHEAAWPPIAPYTVGRCSFRIFSTGASVRRRERLGRPGRSSNISFAMSRTRATSTSPVTATFSRLVLLCGRAMS